MPFKWYWNSKIKTLNFWHFYFTQFTSFNMLYSCWFALSFFACTIYGFTLFSATQRAIAIFFSFFLCFYFSCCIVLFVLCRLWLRYSIDAVFMAICLGALFSLILSRFILFFISLSLFFFCAFVLHWATVAILCLCTTNLSISYVCV